MPREVPTQTVLLATVADAEGHKVDVMDLNALREFNTDEAIVKIVSDTIKEDSEKNDFDLVWLDSSFRTLREARRIVGLLHPQFPDTVFAMGGSAPTSAPGDVLKIVEGLDVAVVGEQEDALVDVIPRVQGQRWEPVKGLVYHWNHGTRRNTPREPKEDLDALPLPNYFFAQLERYFQFSPLPICREAMASKRRLVFSWQRQSEGKDGKTVVRLPSPKRAALSIATARFRYGIDFATLADDDLMLNMNWFLDFLEEYMKVGTEEEEGLQDVVPFSCWLNPIQVVKYPEVVRRMKDAGCKAVQLKIEDSSPEADGIRRTAMELFKRVTMPVVFRYVIGTPMQTLDQVTGMVDFGLANVEDSYELMPGNLFPDGPYFEKHKELILAPYGGDLKSFILDDPKVSPVACGGFDFATAAGVRAMVQTKDLKGLLRLSHERTFGVHADVYSSKCPVCTVEN